MEFLFMDGRKYMAIHTEFSRVLKGHAVPVDVCKYWCRKFKAGDFPMDDRVKLGKPLIELFGAMMSLPSDEPFLSARVLTVRLSSTPQTIKGVLVGDLRMRKFVRRWIPHDLSDANRRERVLKANLLLKELRADEGNEFANKITGEELVLSFPFVNSAQLSHFTLHLCLSLKFSRPQSDSAAASHKSDSASQVEIVLSQYAPAYIENLQLPLRISSSHHSTSEE
jgi:hypothetical protein